MSSSTPTRTTSSRDDVLQFLDSLDDYQSPPPSTTTTRTPLSSSTTAKPLAAAPTTASAPPPPSSTSSKSTHTAAPDAQEAQSVLDFLDEITQRSSTPTATVKPQLSELSKKPSSTSIAGLSRSSSRQNIAGAAASSASVGRRSTDSARSQRSAHAAPPPVAASTPPAPVQPQGESSAGGGGGWGWGSVWSQASSVVAQASNVVQQARTVAEEQVKQAQAGAGGIGGLGEGLMKALGENEQAKKWGEGVMEYARGAHLDQLGKDLKSTTLRSLTDLLNAVAPPIAEHEVIQVSLSHDMVGYDGVETLVYRGLAKIMDQIEGGTLIVNKGAEGMIKPEAVAEGDEERNLNTIEGMQEGWKLAEANLDQLIKASFKTSAPSDPTATTSDLTVPVTTCPVYLRIQPVLAPLPFYPTSAGGGEEKKALFFLMLLRDPTHSLSHESVSQSMPASWLEIPFEENEWVEDVMVDIIRRSVETLGQEYINGRMRAQTVAINKAREEAQRTLDSASGAGTSAPVPAVIVAEQKEQSVQEREESSEAAAVARATL